MWSPPSIVFYPKSIANMILIMRNLFFQDVNTESRCQKMQNYVVGCLSQLYYPGPFSVNQEHLPLPSTSDMDIPPTLFRLLTVSFHRTVTWTNKYDLKKFFVAVQKTGASTFAGTKAAGSGKMIFFISSERISCSSYEEPTNLSPVDGCFTKELCFSTSDQPINPLRMLFWK